MRALTILLSMMTASLLLADESKKPQTDSIPTYNMSEVVVWGERDRVSISGSMYELSGEHISLIDANDAREALSFSPGIYFSQNYRNQSTFRLRGFEQRQVNVFLDGVPITVPFDGQVDISQIAGDNIENIRVSEGLSSVLYGANTLGGAVNIISGVPADKRSLHLRAETSDHGNVYGSLRHHGFWGKLNYVVSFALDRASDFKLPSHFEPLLNEDGDRRDNSAYRKSNASLKAHYPINPAHKVGFLVHYIDNWYHVPPQTGIRNPRYWQFPEWKKNLLSFNSQHILGKNFVLRSVWYLDRYRNVVNSYDDDSYSTQTYRYAFTSIYDDYSLGVILYPMFELFRIGSTNCVLSYKQDTHREKSDESQPFEEYGMETWAVGIEQNVQIHRSVESSFGFDMNYLNPTQAEDLPLRDPLLLFNGQLGFQYQLNQLLALHLVGGKKSRFPTLKELYSQRLGRNIANPDLRAEYSFNTEIGIKRRLRDGYLQLALFHDQLYDLIANRQLGDNTQQLQNIGKATLQGFELVFATTWQGLNLNVNYTFLHARNMSENRSSDHLEYRPKHHLNCIIHYPLNLQFSTQLEGTFTAHQHYQNPETTEWERLNDFVLLNAKLSYQVFSHTVLYARINNLFDRPYFSEFGVPMPGREILIGIRFGL